MVESLQFKLDIELSTEASQDLRFKLYLDWALENGVLMSKMLYPAIFAKEGQHLMGAAAATQIQVNEAYLYVPSKLLITVDRALNSEIGHIFEENAYFFKTTSDRDYLILLLYLIYEHGKGKKSFWYPYFNAIDPGELPCYWEDRVIFQIQDKDLRNDLNTLKNDMETDWGIFRKLMQVYSPEYFDLDVCDERLYRRCAAFVTTRCFGWGLPSSIVAPIADSFNHHAVSPNSMELINKALHLKALKSQSETTVSAYTYSMDWKDYTSTKQLKPKLESAKTRYELQELYNSQHPLAIPCPYPQPAQDLFNQDDDDDDAVSTPELCLRNESLRRKILTSIDLSDEDLAIISSNPRLQEVYNYRDWYRENDPNNYMVFINTGDSPIEAGEQLYFSYGRRTNAYLLHNYGFACEARENPYDSVEIRVRGEAEWEEGKSTVKELIEEDCEDEEEEGKVIRLKLGTFCHDILFYLATVTHERDETKLRLLAKELIQEWDQVNNQKVEAFDEDELPSYQLNAVRTYNRARRDIIQSQLSLL
ncbi:hypothetical protein FGO68_gene12039 [Halteria grandinella]|uniref:SET domain-containing protein n=1 Tax=Halteria grandinella TaxID=5974 RepID=A0A8J8T2Y2_HALGN|nr:hypothetical protein FGO68_gene12039 [Halteria grandinella]